MEQQAKERLTGGVLLVVLLVLLVPELLSGPRPAPPPPPGLPDQAPMRSYAMDIGGSTLASEPVAASTAAHGTEEPALPPPRGPQSPAPPQAGARAPAPPAASAVAPLIHPPVKSAPEGRLPQPTRSHAPAAARSPAPPRVHARGHTTDHRAALWTVQLGTFSNRKNAARLVARLKSHGFHAALSEATQKGHRLIRVRVGSERDRAAAQRLQERLRAAGEHGGEVMPR